MEMTRIKVDIKFTSTILGGMPNNEDVYLKFIASKAPDAQTVEDEIASIGEDAFAEKGTTVFPKEDGKPYFYDYQIKGFFKDSCGGLRRVPGTESNKIKAYKSVIDKLIFIEDRKNFINTDKPLSLNQRPLRAQTMQGERITLACSEEIAEGATMSFTIVLLDDHLLNLIKEWLNYGKLSGLSQWRNAGHGTFEVTNMEVL